MGVSFAESAKAAEQRAGDFSAQEFSLEVTPAESGKADEQHAMDFDAQGPSLGVSFMESAKAAEQFAGDFTAQDLSLETSMRRVSCRILHAKPRQLRSLRGRHLWCWQRQPSPST